MLYSQTTKYCVMALAVLARQQTDQGVRIRGLARDTRIPAPFLGQLIPVLVRAGFLTSKRGRNGGLQFARPAAEIHLADVARVAEGEIFFEDCLLTLDPCDGWRGCSLHTVWGPLRDHIVSFLEETTIEDVARAGLGRLAEVEKDRALDRRTPAPLALGRQRRGVTP